MKYFKFFFLIFILVSSFIFSENEQVLKTAVLFGMKENPSNLFQKEGSFNAKDKDFLLNLGKKIEFPEKMEINKCSETSIGSVSGYVYSFDGAPLEGIELYLFPKGLYYPEMDMGVRYLYNYYGITDSSGFYTLFFEEEGEYVLLAYDSKNLYLPQYYNGKNSYEQADVLGLKKGDNLTGINFNLNKAASISGKVVDSITGEGVWGVYVYTVNPGQGFDYGASYFIYSLTDDEGNYKISGLYPGTYEIYAMDFSNFYGSSTYPDRIAITGSEDVSGVNFSLDPTDTGIKGKIFLPSGEPVSEGWVFVSTFTEFKSYWGYTNSKGEYRVGTEEGKYFVQGGTFDWSTLPTYYPGVRKAKDATPVKVEKGKIIEGVNFQLLPAAFINGTVFSSTAVPLEGIYVEAYDNFGFPVSSSITDGEGNFSIGGLDEGTYYLFAWDFSGDYSFQWYDGKKSFKEANPISLQMGEVKGGIVFHLNPSAKIKGKVVDKNTNSPISDIFIVAYNDNLFYESYGFSDSGGNFEIKGLSTGSYILFAYDLNGIYIPTYYDGASDPSQATLIDVQEGEEVNITFKMIKGGTIRGKVLSSSSVPIPNALVTAYDLQGNWSGFGYSEVDGIYAIGGLYEGSYLIYAMDTNGEYAPKWYPSADSPDGATPVSVSFGEVKENINFYLPPAGSISGKVTDLEGNPLPNMYLFAEKVNKTNNFFEDYQWAYTDENGNYKIKGLGTGDYIVGLILPNGMILYYDGTLNKENAKPVSVIQGQETKNINFKVKNQGGGIAGKVIDSQTSEPVPFAIVTVFDQFGIPVSFSFTDSEGNYIVYFLEAGKYKVYAEAVCYEGEWYREKKSYEEASWVTVTDGRTTGGVIFTLDKQNCNR